HTRFSRDWSSDVCSSDLVASRIATRPARRGGWSGISPRAPAPPAPPAPPAMWHDSILDTIGDTPLVRLRRLGAGLPCTLLAKVEFFNPGGSVNGRIGVAMIQAADRRGPLNLGGTHIGG